MDEPIKRLVGWWTLRTKKPIMRWDLGRGTFQGTTSACQGLSVVNILNVIH